VVDLADGLNILVGPNGAGKTTVLEAASLVLQAAPLRSSNVRDVISRDRDHLRVELELREAPAGSSDLPDCGRGRGSGRRPRAHSRPHDQSRGRVQPRRRRRLTADGTPLEDAGRWKELLPVRTFAPDDLRLIKGSPRRRREYLDGLAAGATLSTRARCAATTRRSPRGTICSARPEEE